jgi:hypothetical protein
LVFLDHEVVMLESAASHPTRYAGKVYVPAFMTDQTGRIYEIDVTRSPPTKTVKVQTIQRLAGAGGPRTKIFGSKLSSDGVMWVLDFPEFGQGWMLGVNLANGNTVSEMRVCQPNDLDIYEENGGNDITVFLGQAYRSEAWVGSNYWCDMWSPTGHHLGSSYGNILEIRVKQGGSYLCGPGSGDNSRCSWRDFGGYAENTNNYQHGHWPVLGRSDYCCDNYGPWWAPVISVSCECMTGPIAGLSYHAGSNQIWSAQLMSLVRTDRNSGASTGQVTAPQWYGSFESEYAGEGYHYGAVDNTKWLADGSTMIAALYEAFYYTSVLASLNEQYNSRKFTTRFNQVVVMAFCTQHSQATSIQGTWSGYEQYLNPSDIASITKMFRYNPTTDNRIDTEEHNRRACQHWDADSAPSSGTTWAHNDVDMPCFSGRVTHVEPVTSSDAFVAINYQSKAVLVLRNAGVSRLECANWQR